MMNTPVEDSPMLESFIKGDNAFRNSRFKLIPYISKVSKLITDAICSLSWYLNGSSFILVEKSFSSTSDLSLQNIENKQSDKSKPVCQL